MSNTATEKKGGDPQGKKRKKANNGLARGVESILRTGRWHYSRCIRALAAGDIELAKIEASLGFNLIEVGTEKLEDIE